MSWCIFLLLSFIDPRALKMMDGANEGGLLSGQSNESIRFANKLLRENLQALLFGCVFCCM